MRNLSPFQRTLIAIVVIVGIASVAMWLSRRTDSAPRPRVEAAPAVAKPAATPAPPSGPAPTAVLEAVAAKARTFDSFRTRPFAVAKVNGANEWTAEDGRDPETILKLAHNELEAQRLLDENPRIKRRQLVYRNEPVPLLLDRARASGEPLKSFTLPALDGRELNVEVKEARVEADKGWGTVTGRLKEHFNSMVSVGFADGYESFNVVSPEEGLYLIGDAREPGEIILKEFDPNVYAPRASGEPDFIPSASPSPQPPKK